MAFSYPVSKRRFAAIALAGLLASAAGSSPIAAQEVTSWTVNGGGQTSSAGSFEVTGTTGQPDAGGASGGSFDLESGFWNSENPFVPVELFEFEIVDHRPEAAEQLASSATASNPSETAAGAETFSNASALSCRPSALVDRPALRGPEQLSEGAAK